MKLAEALGVMAAGVVMALTGVAVVAALVIAFFVPLAILGALAYAAMTMFTG